MAERRYAPLLFVGGLDRQYESHSIESTTARRLLNWQPEPDGSLRVRPRWEPSSDDDRPVRPAKAVGALPVVSGYANPIRRQRKKRSKSGAGVLTIDVGWLEPTLEGSLLLAFVSWSHLSGPTSAISCTPPAGWTAIGTVHGTGASSTVSMRAFKIEDAAEREGDETFTFGSGVHRANVDISEWRGIQAVGAQDVLQVGAGNSVTPDTGISAATDVNLPKQLVIGAIAAKTVGKSIKPDPNVMEDDGYFPIKDATDPPFNSVGTNEHFLVQAMARKVVHESNPQRFASILDATLDEDDAKSHWVAMLVTFRAKLRSATDEDFYIVDSVPDAVSHDLHTIDMDHLHDGTWDFLGNIFGDITEPLVMAYGMGGVLFTGTTILSAPGAAHTGMFYWDGSSDPPLRINRSPRARAIAFWEGRFWAGGTQAHPNRLFWSAVGDPTNWNMDDDFLDVGAEGEWVHDICPVLEGLLVAQRDRLHLVLGPVSQLGRHELDAGGGMRGRCIVRIPGGAVIASENHVWMYQGGGAQPISTGLDDWWINSARSFVSGTYAHGKVFLTGADDNTVVVYEVASNIWWVDKPPLPVSFIYSRDGRTLVAAVDHADYVMRRLHPGSARARDVGHAETFEVETQELLLGSPSRPATPLYLYVAYKKDNYQAGHPPVTVTPVYDGVVHNAREITEDHPVSGATLENGSFRLRLDLGEKGSSACHKVKFIFSYAAPANNTTTFNIEGAELGYEVEERR